MNCPRCQTANPTGARFCLNCGTPLPAACPACDAPIEPDSKRCHNCGHPLVETARAARPSPSQRAGGEAAPAEHAGRSAGVPSARRARQDATRSGRILEGERRVVTVLFCDVKGSTAMAEKLDPEEWVEIMNAAFEHLMAPVYRYGGTVARLLGDAILAFFGAPIAHEDDPQRALLAGLDIVEEIRAYRQQIRRERGLDFDVRVGINTGLVVVAEVGTDLWSEYTAMGDAVNVAARMEQTAAPGTVQISEHTYKLVAPLFDVESLGGIDVKGKREPVRAYRVLGVRARPGRLRGIEGLESPLIGREHEMAVLRRVVDRLREGQGHIVSLVGEAGLGKSRLVRELQAEWETDGGTTSGAPASGSALWYESHGISYASTRPYEAFQQLIRHLSGSSESDVPEVVCEKIVGLLEGVPVEQRERVRATFEVLLGAAPGGERNHLEGETFKRELFQVMESIWRNWATGSPVVLVFDDLQWADPASVELLLHLFRLTEEVPILFLCALRPDPQAPAWRLKQSAEAGYHDRYTEIVLNPLPPAESNALVDSLLDVEVLPPQLAARILEKAEGNPLFVEEVVRTLIDSGVVVRAESGAQWRVVGELETIAIPDSLQALLMARIDRLEEDARHTLQLAAVIGRSFYYRVLQQLVAPAAELDRHLTRLQQVDLIREAARAPELEYIFRHTLTQETAYNSILLKRRREFHRRVGETLELLFNDRLDEYAPALAHHFYEAGLDARALTYFTLAGDAAARLYANAEAIFHYTRALDVAVRGAAESEQLISLFTRRGRAQELNGQYDDALKGYEQMLTLARERGDRSMELAALTARATVLSIPSQVYDAGRAEILSEQALALARELGDRAAEAKILWNMMLLHRSFGRPEEAVIYGEQSLALARELDLREQLAYTLNDIPHVYVVLGQFDRARAALEEARSLWRELGNLPMLADSLGSLVFSEFLIGNYERAISLADEAWRTSERIGNRWGQAYSRLTVAGVYLERGEPDKAIEALEASIRVGEPAGFLPALVSVPAQLGWVYGSLGAVARGLELVHAAEVKTKELGSTPWEPALQIVAARLHLLNADLPAAEAALKDVPVDLSLESVAQDASLAPVLITQGEVALARGEYELVLAITDELIEVRTSGVRSYVPDVLYLRGQALLAQGRAEEALGTLEEARAEAEALGSRRTLWPILFALSRLDAQRVNPAEAESLLYQAREIVTYIADHAGSTELRDLFLNMPRVRAVLGSETEEGEGGSMS